MIHDLHSCNWNTVIRPQKHDDELAKYELSSIKGMKGMKRSLKINPLLWRLIIVHVKRLVICHYISIGRSCETEGLTVVLSIQTVWTWRSIIMSLTKRFTVCKTIINMYHWKCKKYVYIQFGDLDLDLYLDGLVPVRLTLSFTVYRVAQRSGD